MPATVEFNRDIRPIFAETCFLCHGPDKGTRKAGLRLDNREAAVRGVNGRAAIVPGSSATSEIYRRITSADPEQRMPPHETGKPLPPRQISLIKQWIDAGAKYELHWSYIAPQKMSPPAVKRSDWVRNPVDTFILAEIEKEILTPSPEADRRTLIRRLSFDLIGLPPAPEEVDAFVVDQSPDAYEKLVDRLLASEHFGERMAVHWLDLVRFADTVGYHGDQNTDVAPYRDYVIRSFNQNVHYDQFTREQLAGDLLPDATLQQKIASAYNRLNMVTREGGAQAKEYLAKYAADRVRTTSTVWLGATLGCAECHDHKFDPYSMKDFYSFAAFFADIDEVGVYDKPGIEGPFPPRIRVPTPEQQTKLGEFDKQLTALDRELERLKVTVPPKDEIDAWEAKLRQIVQTAQANDVPMVIDDDVSGGKKQEQWILVDKAEGKPGSSGKRIREQGADGLVQHFVIDFAKPHKVGAGDRLYAYVYLDPKRLPETIMLQWHTKKETWSHRAYWGKDLIPYGTIGKDTNDHRRLGDLPAAGQWVRLEVDPAKVGLNPGEAINGVAFTQHAGHAWWDSAGLVTRGKDLPPDNIAAILRKETAARSDADTKALVAFYIDQKLLAGVKDKRATIEKQKQDFEKTIVQCVVTESVKPREVRVLPRGNWMDDSGDIVQPAIPQVFPQPPTTTSRLTRLDFANWMVARDNPLTARVFVNRLWKLYFGTGLSKVLDDLGNRGEWPRHLDLLDWLAIEFMDSGWDVKHMVKLLVTSATYRQTSRPSPNLKEADPYNRLYARQSRPRLDAEFVRDNALAISGLLVEKIGGPSAHPYQPALYYKELNFPRREYQSDKDENQYRRGVYTHWQRTFLHPSLLAFDAPTREECTAERTISNTPLQALTLLNNPTYVEAARVFAEHVVGKGGASFDDRLRWAYRRALSRPPTPAEATALKQLYEKQLAEFQAEAGAAKQLVSVGNAPVPENLNLSELSAWTSVTRTILNLYETMVRY